MIYRVHIKNNGTADEITVVCTDELEAYSEALEYIRETGNTGEIDGIFCYAENKSEI